MPIHEEEDTVSRGLTAMLAARDRRAEEQTDLAARCRVAMLSVTLMSPGPVKDTPAKRRLMDEVLSALNRSLESAGVGILERHRTDGITGPEVLMAVDCDAPRLKRLALALEEEPWGRIVDLDVLDGRAGIPVPLRRESFGAKARACLLCGRPVFECMRARRHDSSDLAEEVDRLTALALEDDRGRTGGGRA